MDLEGQDVQGRTQILSEEMAYISEAVIQAAEEHIGHRNLQDGLGFVPTDVRKADKEHKESEKVYQKALKQNLPQREKTPLWIRVKQTKRTLKKKLVKNVEQDVRRYTDLARKSNSHTPLWKFRKTLQRKGSNKLPKPVRQDPNSTLVAGESQVKEIVTNYNSWNFSL